jgi:hypothetical protein
MEGKSEEKLGGKRKMPKKQNTSFRTLSKYI